MLIPFGKQSLYYFSYSMTACEPGLSKHVHPHTPWLTALPVCLMAAALSCIARDPDEHLNLVEATTTQVPANLDAFCSDCSTHAQEAVTSTEL